MRFHSIAALVCAVAGLAACKPAPEDADAAAPAAEAESAGPAAPAPALLDACDVRMTAPDAREWKTHWDGAHTRPADANPSGVRSSHWANEQELQAARDNGVVTPFEVVCASGDAEGPTISIDIVAYDSSLTDIPLAPGEYPIAPKASPAKNKPREFIVGVLLYDKKMFAATSGKLTLTRFDAEGAAGSFTIDGHEILMGDRPLAISGTFDMPCRRGLLQGACKSDKGELPN